MRRPILLILVVQILLGLVYAASTPPFEASDEISHFPVVRALATTGRLPVQVPGLKTPWAQEGSQPPLYYAVGAALTGWLDTSDFAKQAEVNPFAKLGVPDTADNINLVRHHPNQRPWQGGALTAVYLIRLLSILMATGTVYATYRLAGTAFPRRPRLALLAAALAAFNPMYLFISASVNNDNLAILMTSVALWLLIADLMSVAPGPRWRSTILLGIVMSMAALSKLSGAVLLPVSALVVTISAWRQRSWRVWVLRGATLVAIVLALTGWWFARNLNLYGELFGINRMSIIAGPRPPGFHLSNLWDERIGFWYSYWGVFGGFTLVAPRWHLLLMTVLAVLAVIGLLVLLLRSVTVSGGRTRWSVHVTLLLFLALSLAGVVNWTLKTMASQGRLMFGGIAPISLYLALGLLAWVPLRHRRAVVGTGSVFLAASAAFIAFTTIAPAYRPPTPISVRAAAELITHPVNVAFGPYIHLVGYDLTQADVLPGGTVDLTLYWLTVEALESEYSVFVHGTDETELLQAQGDSDPGGGLQPTSTWPVGRVIVDKHRVFVPKSVYAPSQLRLDVGLYDYATGERLPTSEGDAHTIGYVSVLPPTVMGGLPNETRIDFDGKMRLVGYKLGQRVLSPGDSLDLTLWWEALVSMDRDYVVFAHLVRPPDEVWAQQDQMPQGGAARTSTLRAGERVEDRYHLKLPPNAPPGAYFLEIGVYDKATQLRLPVNSSDKGVILGRVRVEQKTD